MPVTIEEKLDFILTCLKHCEQVKPNYHGVAYDKAMNNANNAQKTFKKDVEESGKYKLSNGTVTAAADNDGSGTAASATLAAAASLTTSTKSRAVKGAAKKVTKQTAPKTNIKRKPAPKKSEEAVDEDEGESDGEAMDTENDQGERI